MDPQIYLDTFSHPLSWMNNSQWVYELGFFSDFSHGVENQYVSVRLSALYRVYLPTDSHENSPIRFPQFSEGAFWQLGINSHISCFLKRVFRQKSVLRLFLCKKKPRAGEGGGIEPGARVMTHSRPADSAIWTRCSRGPYKTYIKRDFILTLHNINRFHWMRPWKERI